MEVKSFYNLKDQLLFKGHEFSVVGVLDTSVRDIVHKCLKLTGPDYRALGNRRSHKEQQNEPSCPSWLLLLNSLPVSAFTQVTCMPSAWRSHLRTLCKYSKEMKVKIGSWMFSGEAGVLGCKGTS